MYKKAISITLLLTAFTSLNAQIGIGTTSPHASSILDIESTTKGFLPPRVSNHTVINNPASGLIVYDETDGCINVYNGTDWVNLCNGSGSSNSSGGFSGLLGRSSDPYADLFGTDLRFKQVVIGYNQNRSGAIDDNNNLFMWGYEPNSGTGSGMISEFNGHVPTLTTRTHFASPYFLSHPQINGKADRLRTGNNSSAHALLTTDSLLFVWGQETDNLLGPNVTFSTTTPVLVDLPASANPNAKIIDATFSFSLGKGLFIITDEGKLYLRGQNSSAPSFSVENSFREIPYPATATDPNFKYVELMHSPNTGQQQINVLFVKGSDNEIYAMGTNDYYCFGNSSVSSGKHQIFTASNIHKVNFPVGHAEITKISNNRYFNLALDIEGNAYGWGYQKTIAGDTTAYFNVVSSTPLTSLVSTRIVEEPALLKLPSEINHVIDISTYPNNYVSGIVGDNNQAYICGNLSQITSGYIAALYNDNANKRYSRLMNASMYAIKTIQFAPNSIAFTDTENRYYWVGNSTHHNMGGYYKFDETSHSTTPETASFLYPMLKGSYDDDHDFIQPLN